jgi:predicted CoA-binding protein
MNDVELMGLLRSSRTIAVVGHSDKPWRDSYRIGTYLRAVGYRVFPVNPNIREVLGQAAYPNLAAVPEPIDIIDVFRAPVHLPQVVEDSLAVGAKALWTQFGVVHAQALERARHSGLVTVADRCIKIEHQRLFDQVTRKVEKL